MRISTTQIFQNGIDTLQRNQQQLNRTQLQLSTGKRILSPSDDPSGAVQSLQFRSGIEKIEQYQRNGTMLEQRLNFSETVLTSVVDGLQRVRELALQGNNATQTNETRGFIAGEIRQALDELMQLANSRDANGEYIFAGNDSLRQPFVKTADEVSFAGDAVQRSLQVSSVRRIQAGDSGERVFVDIPNGNGSFVVLDGEENDDEGNEGTGVVSSTAFSGAWPLGEEFSVEFSDEDGALVYRVKDASENTLVPKDGESSPPAYVSGQPIVYAPEGGDFSIQFTIEGSPADGDSFRVIQAEGQDLFRTYSQLADALAQPVSGASDQARLNNAVNRALVDLDQGLGRLLDVRASLGSRLQAVENQNRINEDQLLQLRSTLSEIEDLDYAEAISRFNLQQTALQAAQQTYVQIQRLSLFNFL
jgi:flagellar hook-associated protein 3 FlgL